jgi:hypothetical protein
MPGWLFIHQPRTFDQAQSLGVRIAMPKLEIGLVKERIKRLKEQIR